MVESSLTWTGFYKGLFYQTNKHLFSAFENKIRHVIVDFAEEMPAMHQAFGYRFGWDEWEYEEWQRHAVMRGARDINDDDIFFLADLDELVSRGYLDAVSRCDPFPNMMDANGRLAVEKCEIKTCVLAPFQYHFSCVRKNGILLNTVLV